MGKETISTKVTKEVKNAIDRYGDRNGHDTRSDAMAELLTVGLREAHSPMLYRIKQQAVDAAFYLTLVAAVTVVVGIMTTALTAQHAFAIAIVTLAIGVTPLAVVETVKVAIGQSEIRSHWHNYRRET
jgi:hypothetical protein